MAIDLSASPYFDDYDATKKFTKILFRPSFAVQARELNQMQTILSAQTSAFADSIYKNGSVVIPGGYSVNNAQAWITTSTSFTDSQLEQFVGATLSNANLIPAPDNITATIISAVQATGTDPVTFYIAYKSSQNTDGVTSTFQTNSNILLIPNDASGNLPVIVTNTGLATSVAVARGVYYIGGLFVGSNDDFCILDKYTNNSSKKVGFSFAQSIVTPQEDSTLFDNAAGSLNFTAPGAHRLKSDLIFTSRDINDTSVDDSFIEVLTIDTGVLVQELRTPEYNVLSDVLAQRTYETNGDYVVNQFKQQVREHLNDGTNGGAYLVGNGGDESKFVVDLDPGVAYVRGYRIETQLTTRLIANKARDVAFINNGFTPAPLGYYIKITGTSGTIASPTSLSTRLPSYYTKVNILDASSATIGTLFTRGVYQEDPTNTNLLDLYVFNIQMDEGKVFQTDAAKLSASVTGGTFTATIAAETGGVRVYGGQDNTPIYQLPYSYVKKLRDLSNTPDTTYSVLKEFVATAGTNTATFNTSGTEPFTGSNSFWVLVNETTGVIYSNVSYAVTSTAVTATGITATSGNSLRLYASVNLSLGTEKTKISTAAVETLAAAATIPLAKADVWQITSIMAGAVDVTSRFTLDSGQRDSYYDHANLILNSGSTLPTGSLVISYNYFVHSGSGDYFSVDSYSNVAYEDIPSYTGSSGQVYQLRDCFDFRPRLDNTFSAFTGTGSSATRTVFPGSDIRADFQYYLPRIDIITVSKSGDFVYTQGTSSPTPKAPNPQSDSITLYQLYVPEYTFDAKLIPVKTIDNRVYTMKDIGLLERRIENLEYYTSLSLLEAQTSSLQILDDTGINKFKNGFVVDSFTTALVKDSQSGDCKVSFDVVAGEARPLQSFKNVSLGNISGSTPANLAGNTTTNVYTLAFTEMPYISQVLGSTIERVLPYEIFGWEGSESLYPNTDSWFDVAYLGDINYYQTNEYSYLYVDAKMKSASVTTSYSFANSSPVANAYLLQWFGVPTATVAAPNTQTKINAGLNPVKSSVTTSITTSKEILNDVLVSTSYVPYMRANNITFNLSAMKPSTKLYAFFDGVNVSQYITPTGGTLGGTLQTDLVGSASGVFALPANSTTRFRTGQRVLRFTNSPTNDQNVEETYAEQVYTAEGVLETRQQSVLVVEDIITKTNRRDPLAESFFIDNDQGAFVTSLDLFFAAKDETAVAWVELREMANGFPTTTIVPGGISIVQAADVNVSALGTVATNFKFQYPVYLQPQIEYCFVVRSTSTKYAIFIATMGQPDLATQVQISKQPYTGVMFRSANNTTWTPDPVSDIKFVMKVAQFTTTAGTLVLQNSNTAVDNYALNPYRNVLVLDPFYTFTGSTTVLVFHKDHGLKDGDSVTFVSGLSGTYNGIPSSELAGALVVANTTQDTYTVTATTTNATSTGYCGNSASTGVQIVATQKLVFDEAVISAQTIVLPSTTLNYSLSTQNMANPATVTTQAVTPGTSTYFSDTQVATSTASSLSVSAVLGTTDPFVSPVINLNRASATVSRNSLDDLANDFGITSITRSDTTATATTARNHRLLTGSSVLVKGAAQSDYNGLFVITVTGPTTFTYQVANSPTSPATGTISYSTEATPSGNAASARYQITPIELASPATSLKVLFDANRPGDSNIQVWFRTQTVADETAIANKTWTQITVPTSYPGINSNRDTFSSYEFDIDSLDAFNVFQIKVVFVSADSADCPRIKSFQAIALAT